VQGDNPALSICESEQVAIARLPWVFAGILDRLRVSVSNECQSREQVGLAGQHHLSLVLNGLDCQEGVAGVLLDLPVDLSLSRVTHYKESGGSERSRKQHKPHQQLKCAIAG